VTQSTAITGRIAWIGSLPTDGPWFARSLQGGDLMLFEEGAFAVLARASSAALRYAEILRQLAEDALPVYVEIDPQTFAVSRLRLPLRAWVADVRRTREGDLDLNLVPSHARYWLRRMHPRFDALQAVVGAALYEGTSLLFTRNDSQDIIDVRPIAGPSGSSWRLGVRATSAAGTNVSRLSSAEVALAFTAIQNLTCDACAPLPGCIPFAYPADGCYVRADLMCQHLGSLHHVPGKIWAYGNLSVTTANDPDCARNWRWHVAPYLEVSEQGSIVRLVLDPALFDHAVPEQEWLTALGDGTCRTALTEASVYYRLENGHEHPMDAAQRSDAELHLRREQQLQCVDYGRPPYGHCRQ
jgi:hypothetical protein